jgi:tetratricopeptide (TPR) repeat protein
MADTEEIETAERRRAVEIEPDGPEWNFALGECLKRHSRPEAEVWLRKAYNLEPTSAHAEALGDVLSAAPERRQEAVVFYEAALKHDNENQEARWSLAKLLIEDPGQAERACDLAIAAAKEASYLCYDTSETPVALCQFPRWREFWIIHQVEQSLEDRYSCDDEGLRQLIEQGWLTPEQLAARYEAALPERLVKIKGDEDELSGVASALTAVHGVFCRQSVPHPVAGFALAAIRDMHRSFPKNEAVVCTLMA